MTQTLCWSTTIAHIFLFTLVFYNLWCCGSGGRKWYCILWIKGYTKWWLWCIREEFYVCQVRNYTNVRHILMNNHDLQICDTFYGISENVSSFKLFCFSIINPELFLLSYCYLLSIEKVNQWVCWSSFHYCKKVDFIFYWNVFQKFVCVPF
jgi:hypothetical protein